MKRTLLLACSILSFVFLNAQTVTYHPLHGDYSQYVYRFQLWDGSNINEAFYKTVWSGDSTINGQVYTRIFHGSVYGGGIREDVANQQRFFINTNDIETNITITHDLAVGTLLTDSSVYLNAFRTYLDDAPFFAYYDTLMVATRDSVLEPYGNYSITYRLTNLQGNGESVLFNTYSGLLEVNGFEYNYSQICYREDGEQTPPGQETPWTPMCDLGTDENDLLQIELFPNPVSEVLNLSGDLAIITDLTIYDVNGTRIKQVPLSEIYSGISLKELRNGIYLLAFNGGAKTFRFVKQN
nr:T9SS type A sorting domain-containing protein [uncultured Fluviicola sp.]